MKHRSFFAISLILLLVALTVLAVSLYNSSVRSTGCNVRFVNSRGVTWTDTGKDSILEACDVIFLSTGFNELFKKSPIELVLRAGYGGAEAYKDEKINLFLGNVQDTRTPYSTFLHEGTHALDYKRGREAVGSLSDEWLGAAGWSCESKSNLDTCSHPCKQTQTRAFFCSFKDYEVLPSRYGDVSYDPNKADVSINPAEDFAESSRYFFEANDELSMTSPKRCEFMRNYYSLVQNTACFDCNVDTLCDGQL
jgi:hypothetical protein